MWHWDPPAFLDGGSYWIKEVQRDRSPDVLHECGRQSFFIFTQPFLLSAGIGCIALGVMFTLGRIAVAWWPRHLTRLVIASALTVSAVAALAADVRATILDRERAKPNPKLDPVRNHAAISIASPVVERLFDQVFVRPDRSGNLPALMGSSLQPGIMFDGQKIRRKEVFRTLAAQQRDAIAQRRTVENWRHTCGARSKGMTFWHTIHFECYTEPLGLRATGGRNQLTVGGRLPSGNKGFISEWEYKCIPLYSADSRDLGAGEARNWVNSFLHALSTAGCPDLESFLLPTILRSYPGDPDRSSPCDRATLCTAFRSERARWDTLNFAVRDQLSLKRLPGARWQFNLPLTQSGTRPDGREESSPVPLNWDLEIVFVENRWQIFRFSF